MSVNLKVTLGVVNYTDYIRVTASKISSPGVLAYEQWFPAPLPANYSFIIPNLDPENYYVRAYDAPTNVSAGTLVVELLVNALTNEFIWERRFYTCGGPGTYDPAPLANKITDPYLIGKNVTGMFREAFRYLIPSIEFGFDDTIGEVEVLIGGVVFNQDEVIAIEIKYAAGTIAASSNGFYNGILNVPEAVKTLLSSDRNKKVRCVGTATTQVITLPLLAALTEEDGYYFDNGVGGKAIQVKILLQGGDRIKYSGFMSFDNDMSAVDEFAEFWVSRGEHLLVRKLDAAHYEVVLDYKGVLVGNRQSGRFLGQPGWVPEDGRQLLADEYPRLWWWINTLLPATHYIKDDAIIASGVHPANKRGLFVINATGTNKIMMPNTQDLSEMGLKDFDAYGADADRGYDYPGGEMAGAVKEHRHMDVVPISATNNPGLAANQSIMGQNETGGIGDFKYTLAGHNNEPTVGRTGLPVDKDTLAVNSKTRNIVDNFGVIYHTHI